MKTAESNQIRALEVKERGRHSEELQVVQGAWHPCEWGMLGVPGRVFRGRQRGKEGPDHRGLVYIQLGQVSPISWHNY